MSASPTFERAEAYLIGTIGETISPRAPYKLDRMRAFLRALGDPHRAYPTIHVGGTSGKGSTCTMIASVLQVAGKRTGLHTKPHLQMMTERARIDGVPVAPERFAEILERMMPAIERIAAIHGRPTYYETLLALAFVHFADEKVDVAVVEVGLGGRLDGTNVLQPEVSAITSIGYDHTDVLGETLESIAREKAGIARAGVPLIVAAGDPQTLRTLKACAAEAGAPMVRVRDVVTIEPARLRPPFAQSFAALTASNRYDVDLPVHGLFQVANSATAIAVLERLNVRLRPTRQHVERGLAAVAIPGRMEVFSGEPACVLDIAHNAEKAQSLAASLREIFPNRRVQFVVAIGESKDAVRILSTLATVASTFTFTAFEVAGRRATDPKRLAAIGASLGIPAVVAPDPAAAFKIACRTARRDDVVVATGSTFIVAALRESLVNRFPNAAEPSTR